MIEHDPAVLRQAMKVNLRTAEVGSENRLQLYRTALDSLLGWMSLVEQALDRKLFEPEDVAAVRYWLRKIDQADWLRDFVKGFDYDQDLTALKAHFRRMSNGPISLAKWRTGYRQFLVALCNAGTFSQCSNSMADPLLELPTLRNPRAAARSARRERCARRHGPRRRDSARAPPAR